MELDKRIASITDIYSVNDGCHDWKFMNQKGYFANRIVDFQDLSKCVYGEYNDYREHDKCFSCKVYSSNGTSDSDWFTYFIPEDDLKPKEPEKKYRPYTMSEFKSEFKINIILTLRKRNEDKYVYQTVYLGNRHYDDTDSDENFIYLSHGTYSLKELFEKFEIVRNGDWQPFGIIDEDKE